MLSTSVGWSVWPGGRTPDTQQTRPLHPSALSCFPFGRKMGWSFFSQGPGASSKGDVLGERKKPQKGLATHLLAGGGAGLVESCTCHPLDTIKVRMQLRGRSRVTIQVRLGIPTNRSSSSCTYACRTHARTHTRHMFAYRVERQFELVLWVRVFTSSRMKASWPFTRA